MIITAGLKIAGKIALAAAGLQALQWALEPDVKESKKNFCDDKKDFEKKVTNEYFSFIGNNKNKI